MQFCHKLVDWIFFLRVCCWVEGFLFRRVNAWIKKISFIFGWIVLFIAVCVLICGKIGILSIIKFTPKSPPKKLPNSENSTNLSFIHDFLIKNSKRIYLNSTEFNRTSTIPHENSKREIIQPKVIIHKYNKYLDKYKINTANSRS